MHTKKQLLVLTSTFPRWKNDKEPPFVYELCHQLGKHYKIHVLAPHYPNALLTEEINGINVTRFRYFLESYETLAFQGGILPNLKASPWKFSLIPFFICAELIALICLLRRHPIDIIHAHWLIHQGIIALWARLFRKTKLFVLCTSHGGDLFGLKGPFFKCLKRYVLSNADAVTVVSNTMRDEAHKLIRNKKNIHVIPMGVDLQKTFIPPAKRQEGNVMLFIGRLVEKKGLKYVLEALPLIFERFPKTKLLIAGDGTEKSSLIEYAKTLGIIDHLIFLGAVPHDTLPALYQKADVVVFPSVIAQDGDREGFGLVLVEALGCESATISTDLPAMRDIVVNEENAIVVQQKSPEQIANAAIRLFENPELRLFLGKNGRRFVLDLFDWSVIANRYDQVIQSLLL